LIKLCCLCI